MPDRKPCQRYQNIWRSGDVWLKVPDGAVCPRCGFTKEEHSQPDVDLDAAFATADAVCGMSLSTDWEEEAGHALEVLAAEVRRLRGQTCSTCRHNGVNKWRDQTPWCVRLNLTCWSVGGRCGNYEPKAGA